MLLISQGHRESIGVENVIQDKAARAPRHPHNSASVIEWKTITSLSQDGENITFVPLLVLCVLFFLWFFCLFFFVFLVCLVCFGFVVFFGLGFVFVWWCS